jgi:predicted ester cyclase
MPTPSLLQRLKERKLVRWAFVQDHSISEKVMSFVIGRLSASLKVFLLTSAPLLTGASLVAAQEFDRPSCQSTPEGEALLAVLEAWNTEVWQEGNLERVADLVGPSYLRHQATGTRTVTPEEYAAEIGQIRGAMPDIRFHLHDCAAIGDRVWTRWTMEGTDQRTGQSIQRMGMQIYRLVNGRLVETWSLALPSDGAWPERGGTGVSESRKPSGNQ